MTLYTRRNFVNGTPAARQGLFDWFLLQKGHFIYMSPVQKQGTGRKMGKNPPKKGVFLAPPASWLSLNPNEPAPLGFELKRAGSSGCNFNLYPNEPARLGAISICTQTSQLVWVQTQPAGRTTSCYVFCLLSIFWPLRPGGSV